MERTDWHFVLRQRLYAFRSGKEESVMARNVLFAASIVACCVVSLPAAGGRQTIDVAPGVDAQRVLDTAPDGSEVRFKAGDYPIETALYVSNKTDFVISGEPAHVLSYAFRPRMPRRSRRRVSFATDARG